MTDEETVEVPLRVVRNAADLTAYNARTAYSNNDTVWGDRFHGTARELNEAADDEWDDVGMDRFTEDGHKL